MPVQSVASQSEKSDSAVTITANKMDANNKIIVSTSTGSERCTSIDVAYIKQCIIYQLDPRHLPDKCVNDITL